MYDRRTTLEFGPDLEPFLDLNADGEAGIPIPGHVQALRPKRLTDLLPMLDGGGRVVDGHLIPMSGEPDPTLEAQARQVVMPPSSH